MVDVKHWDLFPTRVYQFKYEPTARLLNYIDTIVMESEIEGLSSQSENNLLHKETAFKDFTEKLIDLIKNICKDNQYAYEYKSIEITNFWFNETKKGNIHAPHNHSNNIFSGVWYPFESKEKTDIQFFDPRIQAGILQPRKSVPNHINSNIMSFPNLKNQGLIFPSWLKHWVPPAKESRMSFSWNILIRGRYGESDDALQNAHI